MEFELSSDEEDEEVEETEEWSSNILTHEDFNFDHEFVGPTMRMLPSKSALDFFHIIFTEDVYALIVTQTNLYAAQQRRILRCICNVWLLLMLAVSVILGCVQHPAFKDSTHWKITTLMIQIDKKLMLSGEVYVADQGNEQEVVLVCKDFIMWTHNEQCRISLNSN